ncbi:hypothetical protein THAOC_24287, partial [Thalassiosira oceanica]
SVETGSAKLAQNTWPTLQYLLAWLVIKGECHGGLQDRQGSSCSFTRVLELYISPFTPPGRCGPSSASSLEPLVVPGLETFHCVSRVYDNSVRPTNPAASEYERNAPAEPKIAILVLTKCAT